MGDEKLWKSRFEKVCVNHKGIAASPCASAERKKGSKNAFLSLFKLEIPII
jgi:hypothetical protein